MLYESSDFASEFSHSKATLGFNVYVSNNVMKEISCMFQALKYGARGFITILIL